MKTTLGLLITLLFLNQSASSQVNVVIDDVSAPLGTQVSVPILLTNVENSGMASAFTLSMNALPVGIRFDGADFSGSLVEAWGNTKSCNTGSLFCNGFDGTGTNGISTSGTLLTLLFTITDSPTGDPVTFSQFNLNDGFISTVPALPSFTISLPADTAPVALADNFVVDEGAVLNISAPGVLANDSDPNGDPLSAVLVQDVSRGSLNLNADGSFTYSHDGSETLSDSFSYRASDGSESSAETTVFITVSPVNDFPVADDLTITGQEDSSSLIILQGSDSEGSTLTYNIVTPAQNGTVVLSGFTATYTPTPNFFGSDSFQYTVSDGFLTSAPADVTITVEAVNDAPVVSDAAIDTEEDTAGTALLTATDVESDAVTFSIGTAPANGTAVVTGSTVEYTPNADFNGSDSFTVIGNDGTDNSAPAIVTVTVTAVNDLPTVADAAITTDEAAAGSVDLVGTDVDGDALTFSVASGPVNGSVEISGATATYTPASGFSGSDSFTVVANDGTVNSEPATVSVTVNKVNSAPVAQNVAVVTNEDTPLAVTLSASDADGDPLTFTIQAAPSNGTVGLTGAMATYTPSADFNGTDTFTYVANDGAAASAPATVSITVEPVNDAPTVENITANTLEEEKVVISLAGSDVDGDVIMFLIASNPQNGSVALSGESVSYSPGEDFVGTDSFTYVATDGFLTSSPATVTVIVGDVNDAPVATSATVSLSEDTSITVVLEAADPENDPVSFSVVSQPENGSLSALSAGNSITYTPDLNFYGEDTMVFTASDGTLTSDPASITFVVEPVNDAPTAEGLSVSTPEGTSITISLSGADVDGDELSFDISLQPFNGSVSVSGSTATYSPNPGFTGDDAFLYTVSDGSELSAAAAVQVVVTPAERVSAQFVHTGSSGLPAQVDVLIGAEVVTKNLAGGQASSLLELPVGTRTLTVREAGASSSIIEQSVELISGNPVVISLVAPSPGSAVAIVSSLPTSLPSPGNAALYVQHVHPDFGSVDVVRLDTSIDHLITGNVTSGLTFGLSAGGGEVVADVILLRVRRASDQSEIEVFKIDAADRSARAVMFVFGEQSIAVDSDGAVVPSVISTDTDVSSGVPHDLFLRGTYPNPFVDRTRIEFDLPEAADVEVRVMDMLGRTMMTVPSRSMPAGTDQHVEVTASDLSSGIYLYQVIATGPTGTRTATGTMTLLK